MQRLGGEPGRCRAAWCACRRATRMTAIDPVTGRTLWTRTDVSSRAHVFGDDEHIYVVGMGENNTATGTRVFRAYDGVSVRVPDFSDVYEKRIRVMGRHILAADPTPRAS